MFGGLVEEPLPFDTTHITSPGNWSNPQHGDPCHPITTTAHVPAVAYGCNNTSGSIDVAGALNASHTASGRQDFETETFIAHTLKGEGFDASEDGTGRGVPLVAAYNFEHGLAPHGSLEGSDIMPSLGQSEHKGHTAVLAFQDRFRGDDGRGYGRVPPVTEDAIGTLETVKPWNVASRMAVRRLTPTECARLQGFPDEYLDITYRGKPAADGNKYQALGNAMATPVIRWICERVGIQL